MPEKKNVASSQETLLKVEHLCQYFKENKAVDDVSFEVKKGEVFGLVGESGCGKTTTGRSIIKLYNITSGNVYFKGERIAAGTGSYKWEIEKAKKAYTALKKSGVSGEKLKDAKKKRDEVIAEQKKQIRLAQADQKRRRAVTDIQMIFQDPFSSFNTFNKIDTVLLDCINMRGGKHLPKEKKIEMMTEACSFVNLKFAELTNKYPFELSGGQMQRLMIARIFLLKPKILLADEPTSMVDACSRATILDMLLQLRDEIGMTVIFITHDIGLAYYISDTVYIMEHGRFVEFGKADEVILNPKAAYTKRLISDVPKIHEEWDLSTVELK